MLRYTLLMISLCLCTVGYGQQNEQVSTMDFVQILNNNEEEALFYYQHNWQDLREMAAEKGYIVSFQFLETQASEEAPFHLILITTYEDEAQYAQREAHFSELIKAKGKLELMNDLKPDEFRKTLFSKEMVRHLDR